MTKPNKSDRYMIQSVEKALDVIEVLSQHDSLSLMELVELVEQPKSSLYRIITTLENKGFIGRDADDGKYCLGYKQLSMTKNLLDRISIRTFATPDMSALLEKYGDTVNLVVLSDGEVLYVEIMEGTNALRMMDKVGSRQPFHATATGKAMVAHLPETQVLDMIQTRELMAFTPHTLVNEQDLLRELTTIRAQGYAVDHEEITLGARCVAAPVFNMHGTVEGAISISGSKHRFADERLKEIAQDIKLAGERISHKLGYSKSSRKDDSP